MYFGYFQVEESEFEGGESIQSIETVETMSRGRSTTRGRARRAGSANSNRGRGRGGLVEEDDSQQRIMAHDQLQACKFIHVLMHVYILLTVSVTNMKIYVLPFLLFSNLILYYVSYVANCVSSRTWLHNLMRQQ